MINTAVQHHGIYIIIVLNQYVWVGCGSSIRHCLRCLRRYLVRELQHYSRAASLAPSKPATLSYTQQLAYCRYCSWVYHLPGPPRTVQQHQSQSNLPNRLLRRHPLRYPRCFFDPDLIELRRSPLQITRHQSYSSCWLLMICL